MTATRRVPIMEPRKTTHQTSSAHELLIAIAFYQQSRLGIMLQPIDLNSPGKEPIELTQEELHKFEEAFKNPEFRNLFRSYLDDISSPETRQKYEAQITELERERGNSIRWVRPTGRFTFQTRLLNKHQQPQCLMTAAFQGHDTDIVMVNVASSPEISPPVSKRAASKGARGTIWSIPHSITPPRPGVHGSENSGNFLHCVLFHFISNVKLTLHSALPACIIIDVIFHPDAFKQASMADTLISTAIESISTKLLLQLSTIFSKLESQTYVGIPINTVIREQNNKPTSKNAPCESPTTTSSISPTGPKQRNNALEEPRHSITHQHKVNIQDFASGMGSTVATHPPRPEALLVRFDLPKVARVEQIDVDVHDKSVILTVPGQYHCVLPLPYNVDSNDCAAKWIGSKSILEIHCPVQPYA
ncbi:pre-RNA processing PIH1/Nop17-domain-containing protein, partial [Catenaria anguillulae PL171]